MPLNEKILLTDIIFTFHCFTIFADSTLSSSNRMKNPITAFTLYKVAQIRFQILFNRYRMSHFSFSQHKKSIPWSSHRKKAIIILPKCKINRFHKTKTTSTYFNCIHKLKFDINHAWTYFQNEFQNPITVQASIWTWNPKSTNGRSIKPHKVPINPIQNFKP